MSTHSYVRELGAAELHRGESKGQSGEAFQGAGLSVRSFDSLTIERKRGAQPRDGAFIRMVHEMTLRASTKNLPLDQTVSRLSRANLGHYVYMENSHKRRLIGYTLNELFNANAQGVSTRVNYFCSAFILPQTRSVFSLYRFLWRMRLTGREDLLLIRTQSPLVMTSFLRLCRRHRYRTFTPLSENVPRAVQEVVTSRFADGALVHRAVYPGRISPPMAPPTQKIARLMALIEPDRGDACVFAASTRRGAKPSTRLTAVASQQVA
jgi:hypothetical protein